MTYSFIDLVVVMTDSMTDDWHFRLERCPRILISWDRYCKQENTRWFNFLQLIAMTVRWWERSICLLYIFSCLCFFLLLIIVTLSSMWWIFGRCWKKKWKIDWIGHPEIWKIAINSSNCNRKDCQKVSVNHWL